MAEILPAVLVVVAIGLFALALWLMTAGRFGFAGAAFLCASIAIYVRETLAQEG
ncbi:hypothetical protein [Halobaculum gomorrense]|uniref:Uncharacterized protein n=1 Tax=Halobaculum gomorrense TaxID=43928 RepID=A0A1M5PD43_9EURY|nr:hypothetical protein [Halobaculum gomorrense]SHG99696.1 hypothetical protein SAMN05443636_1554 [Halobaculum gomorrense]